MKSVRIAIIHSDVVSYLQLQRSTQQPSSGIYSAPSGLSDSSTGSSAVGPSFSIRAPGYSGAYRFLFRDSVSTEKKTRHLHSPAPFVLSKTTLLAEIVKQPIYVRAQTQRVTQMRRLQVLLCSKPSDHPLQLSLRSLTFKSECSEACW